MRLLLAKILLAITVLGQCSLATADTARSGRIVRMDAVAAAGGAPAGFDTRVYLDGISDLCPGATESTWAYINANDANYKGVLATLLLAYATGKAVVIYSNPIQVSQGGVFCQIKWINVVG